MVEKIATCSYCGRRSALVLADRGHMELACGSCGAPLTDLKALRPAPEPRGTAPKRPKPPPHRVGLPAPSETGLDHKLAKHRRKLKKKLAKRAFGVLKDLFD